MIRTPTQKNRKDIRVRDSDESDDEDEGVREENDDDLVAANNDVELVTAAGFADL
jgi:hypothetical protein